MKLGLLALALIALSCGSTRAPPRSDSSPPESPPGVTRTQGPHPRTTAKIPVGPHGQTTAIAEGDSAIWVAAYGVRGGGGEDGAGLYRIDPERAVVERTIPTTVVPGWEVGGGGLTFGNGSMWIAGYTKFHGKLQGVLQRVSTRTNRVVATTALGGTGGADVAAGLGSIWVAVSGTRDKGAEIVQVDPGTNEIVGRTRLESRYVRRILVAPKAVVVQEYEWPGPHGILTTIDPKSGSVLAREPTTTETGPASGIVAVGNEIWAILGNRLAPLESRTGSPSGEGFPFDADHGPRGFLVAVDRGFYYGAYPGRDGNRADRLTRMDAMSGDITVYGKSSGSAAAVLDDSIWTVDFGGTVRRIELS
ncbi:MAG: hypothetical protein WD757_05835 [Actinomycetota bacterium]